MAVYTYEIDLFSYWLQADKDGQSRHHYYFLDFTGGIKPYLLTEMNNNMGALTKVAYRSSIQYYLEDENDLQLDGKQPYHFLFRPFSELRSLTKFRKANLPLSITIDTGIGMEEKESLEALDGLTSSIVKYFRISMIQAYTTNNPSMKWI